MTLNIGMVTLDCPDPKELAAFWTKALDAKIVHEVEDQFLIMALAGEQGVLLGLQRVPEPKAGKNRVHVDLHTEDPGGRGRAAGRARCHRARGAPASRVQFGPC